MDAITSYRGFVKITENYNVDSEYAVFRCDMDSMHPVIYRNHHDKSTWCLGCDELNIHDMNMCPACTCDSWKRAVDFAIMHLHHAVRKLYDTTALMALNNGDKQNTDRKAAKFNCYDHGRFGSVPCCEARFSEYDIQVYQDNTNYGDTAPWYLTCKDVEIYRYQIGICRDAKCAVEAAICIIKNKIDDMHTIACSLEA